MKLLPSPRVYALVLVSTAVAGAIAIAACTGDDAAAVDTPDSGGLDSGGNPDSQATTPDAALEDSDAGEEIIDAGGGLPPEDEDGGTTDVDGGFDGGTSCASLTVGSYVESKCAFLSIALKGGTLSTGTYFLKSVSALGNKTYCASGGGYVAYDHRGVLEVTATSPTAAMFEFLDQYKKSGVVLGRPTTNRYDVAVSASGNTLTYSAQACALKTAPASALYATGTVTETGKKTITLRLPYGTGTANFYYVEQ